jgi:hypothetical protein
MRNSNYKIFDISVFISLFLTVVFCLSSAGIANATITETGSNTNSSASNGDTATITHGLTINENDVIIAIVHRDNGADSISDNNGAYAFTESFEEVSAAASRYAIYYRVAGASEPATYSWNLGRSEPWSVVLRVFSGVDTTSVWDITPSASTRATVADGTSVTAPSMTTTTDGAMGIIVVLSDSALTWSNPSNGYGTEVEDSVGRSTASYIRTWDTAGPTGTASADLSNNNDMLAHQVALKSYGLIGHWKFDEGSGQTATDSSGSGNDGTLGTTAGVEDADPTWECVAGGYALTFDGNQDDEVLLANPTITGRTVYTITAWIKTSSSAKMTIYGEGNTAAEEYLYIDKKSDGTVEFYLRNPPYYPIFSGTTVVDDGAWHLVTLVQRSPTDRELYIGSGSEATNSVDSGTPTHDTASIGLLRASTWTADPFLGTIDDVRIYDRALSPAEIAALAASPPSDCGWMATGSYTGNGTSQSISSLGFQPEVVWIKADDTNYSGAMSTSTMGSNKTKTLEGTGTLHSGSITSLDSDGFSVGSGTDVNADTVTYYWTAFDAAIWW